MLNLLLPDRRALLGALAGAGAAYISTWFADAPERFPLAALLVVVVAVVGLLLGARAALWCFLAAALVLLVAYVLPADEGLSPNDIVRIVIVLLGSPLIVLLVQRADMNRELARDALEASHTARTEAEAERQRLEAARRDLDAALAAAERDRARLEEVAEAIPEPLVVYDDELRGTYGNRAALRLFGRSFVERPIDEWSVATEPRDERGKPLDRPDWPQVRAQAEAFRRRLLLRIPMSGRDVMVDVEGTPIPGGGAVLLLRDVGKEEDERRRLSRFASFVAHELRNPLAVAKARIELAQRDPELPRRAGSHGARALESVDAAIGILERLELYSRADSGRIDARREPFDVGPAVGAAIERLRARGSEREVRVAMEARTTAVGDRHLSEQAITNLLTNADRYSAPGAPIDVEVEASSSVTLRVRDAGPGIADDIGDRLFREQVTAGRGLGLGLFLVRATMEAMGGSVQLEQRRPVAVFALRWPAQDAEDDRARASTP
jgi:signal transduction histidine kinase